MSNGIIIPAIKNYPYEYWNVDLPEMHKAARVGDLALLKEICNKIGINDKDQHGWTALMHAAKNNHFDCVKFLVNEGALVNEKNNYGHTSLMRAARNGHLDCVKFLVKEGRVQVNDKDNDGWTALIWATVCSRLKCIQYLVKEGGADMYIKTNDGKTVFDMNCFKDVQTFFKQAAVASLITVFIHGQKNKNSWLIMDNIRILHDMLHMV